MNSKSLVNCFVWNQQIYFEKCVKKKKIPRAPQEFYHRFMYIAPSSDLLFKVTLWRFEEVFWCLEWECCIFQKIDENSFKSNNTIWTMALIHNLITILWLKKKKNSPVSGEMDPPTQNGEIPDIELGKSLFYNFYCRWMSNKNTFLLCSFQWRKIVTSNLHSQVCKCT